MLLLMCDSAYFENMHIGECGDYAYSGNMHICEMRDYAYSQICISQKSCNYDYEYPKYA